MKIEIAKERFNTVHTQASFLPDGIVELRKIDKEQPDENTYLKLNEMVFHNGIIEVEVCGRLLPDAPDFARGFIGIVFRANESDSEFESFYIRPANGKECSDSVRKAHGCQYFSYPGYTFAYFREYGIDGYEAPMNCGLDEWVRLKAVIHDDRAAFYLNDNESPVLTVSGLKHGANAKGSVGFFVDIGTEGFFKDLVITQEESK